MSIRKKIITGLKISFVLFLGLSPLTCKNSNNNTGSPTPPAPVKPTTTVSHWTKQSPLPTFQRISSIYFVDKDHGWVSGDQGSISSTIDGGKTWKERKSEVTESLLSIYFADKDKGWAVGGDNFAEKDGVILATTNGGEKWKKQKDYPTAKFNGIKFVDSAEGWAVGTKGTVLHTVNGGESWVLQDISTSEQLADIYAFKNDSKYYGWIVGAGGVVFSLSSDGKSWQKEESGLDSNLSPVLRKIFFLDENEGWAIGWQGQSGQETGIALHSTNGGKAWNLNTNIGLNNPLFRGVVFLNAETGWIIGNQGLILATRNKGEKWDVIENDIKEELRDIKIINNQSWIVGARGTILLNDDLNQTDNQWVNKMNGTTKKLNDIVFRDNKGWAIGSEGTILYTEDKGSTWNKQISATQTNLLSVFFISGTKGWAVGEDGIILKTTDGLSWKEIKSSIIPMGTILNTVFFSNDGPKGWIVGSTGEEGLILRSFDGGDTWEKITLTIEEKVRSFNSLWFFDKLTGWLVGEGGVILKTINGGSTWESQSSGILNNNLLKVIFPKDNKNGWAVGTNGTIIKTTDGGEKWQTVKSATTENLNNIVVKEKEIWIIGSKSAILYSKDLGAHWETQFSDSGEMELSGLFFDPDGKTGWVTGEDGLIIHTTSGGM